MFPNNSPSNNTSPTSLNNDNMNNNCCSIDALNVNETMETLIDNHSEIVVITKHLCSPCPRMYTDIFKTILIVCKDPSHQHDDYLDDNKLNNKIQKFKAKKNVT